MCTHHLGIVAQNQDSPKTLQVNVNSYRPGLTTTADFPSWITIEEYISRPFQDISVDLDLIPFPAESLYYKYTGSITLESSDGGASE